MRACKRDAADRLDAAGIAQIDRQRLLDDGDDRHRHRHHHRRRRGGLGAVGAGRPPARTPAIVASASDGERGGGPFQHAHKVAPVLIRRVGRDAARNAATAASARRPSLRPLDERVKYRHEHQASTRSPPACRRTPPCRATAGSPRRRRSRTSAAARRR